MKDRIGQLILCRKVGEKIMIGDDIVLTVVDIRRGSGNVRLGVEAPQHVRIDRKEVREEQDGKP